MEPRSPGSQHPSSTLGCGRIDHPKTEAGQARCPRLLRNKGSPSGRLDPGEQASTQASNTHSGQLPSVWDA